jgi:hypothetical protein
MEDIKHWLIDILPNLKHIVVFGKAEIILIMSEKIETLKIRNLNDSKWLMECGYIHFPNLQVVEIEVVLENSANLNTSTAHLVIEILNSFANSKTLMIYFYYEGLFCIKPIIDLSALVFYLMEYASDKNYQIKQYYNRLQFIKN